MAHTQINHLPEPKYNDGDYITDGGDQSFEISFIEYDFDKEEYYYLPLNGQYAGKIYESKANLTDRPKSSSMKMYEFLFGDRESLE